MSAEPNGQDGQGPAPTADGAPAADFGAVARVRGALRRRLGLSITRLLVPRVRFGPRCDVRSGAHFAVARGADVRFGAGCVLDHGFTLESTGRLVVGDRTVFGHHCTVASDRSVVIGSHCLFGEFTSIRDHDHAFDGSTAILDQGRATAPVTIGDDVWVGAKATITRGVTIGSGAVVGAHAVVTHDLPPGCVAVGVPARVVRMRDGGPVPG
jgi:acetyltransferase-like isoleucine patch superfamily enzyme